MSQNYKKNKSRIFYLDALKALAIFGIVLCHITANFIGNMAIINTYAWKFTLFCNCFVDFSVPIFVMISGALLINKDYELTTFFKKKLNRIFVPYTFWILMYIIFACACFNLGIKLNGNESLSLDFIYRLIFGLGGYGRIFWFVWMITVVYIVSFIINKIIKKHDYIPDFDSTLINVLLVSFFIYIIIVSLGIFIPSPIQDRYIYYLSFVGYALIGYKLTKTDFTNLKISKMLDISEKTILIGTFILSILFYLILLYFKKLFTGIEGSFATISYFNILNVLLSSCIFLFFRYFEEYDGNKVQLIYTKIKDGIFGMFINSISKCSFGIYLSHKLIRNFILIFIYGAVKLSHANPFKWISFLMLLVFITSWILVWIMSKLPYLNKVSGSA